MALLNNRCFYSLGLKKWKSFSCVRLFVAPMDPWNSVGQNTGVGSLDQTHVSRIAGRYFTSWASVEAQENWSG